MTTAPFRIGNPILSGQIAHLDDCTYSMAGSAGLSKAPAAASEASLGADSTKFVSVPLDVMQAYFYRAKRTTCTLPVSKRLNWLQARDTEERSEWVSRFRESALSLGQVVREAFVMRDAHWPSGTWSDRVTKECGAGSGGYPFPVRQVDRGPQGWIQDLPGLPARPMQEQTAMHAGPAQVWAGR